MRRIAIAVVSVVLLCSAGRVSAHPTGLPLKRGAPTPVESGPHGGGVIDVGDGHFELVRGPDGVLSLFRLDENLKTIPAGDVAAAHLYVLGPMDQTPKVPMAPVRDGSGPLYFRVNPKVTQGGYLAVVSVSMDKATRNLRFQVAGVAQK